MRLTNLLLFVFFISVSVANQGRVAVSNSFRDEISIYQHQVLPGDTWEALGWRFDTKPELLIELNGYINQDMQPPIGSLINIPVQSSNPKEKSGRLMNTNTGGLLQLAVLERRNPWEISLINELEHPYRPTLFKLIYLPQEELVPRELPYGFRTLDVSQVTGNPGQGLALRAVTETQEAISVTLSSEPFVTASNDGFFLGLIGLGGFFPPGLHELTVVIKGYPRWTQLWRFEPRQWTFEQITLTGSAAAIDAESIRLERERLFTIWSQMTPEPLWNANFQNPINQFLDYSSAYGARRSYNGGPYNSYHEGVDFSAYAGTPVFAPADGKIVLAEQLFVRGGAVIIDHGLGVFTGLYHLSEVIGQPGQTIKEGDIVGRVGTTGLSTGNHLHWDLLVAGQWIDAAIWRDSGIGCWILEGWGRPCEIASNT